VRATATATTAKSSRSSTASRVATATADGPKRKKRRRRNRSVDVDSPSELLAGLRIYVIHCKEDLERKSSRPICHVIRDQVEALVRARGLGAEILSAEQGMSICTSPRSPFFFDSISLMRAPRSYLVSPFTSFIDGLFFLVVPAKYDAQAVYNTM